MNSPNEDTDVGKMKIQREEHINSWDIEYKQSRRGTVPRGSDEKMYKCNFSLSERKGRWIT
jgi:hypothetical protein